MQTERDLRIQKIRSMSTYLLRFMTLVQFGLVFIALLALIALMFTPRGETGIATVLQHVVEEKGVFATFEESGITTAARWFCILAILYVCIPSVYIVRQVCKLLACFQAGDIFNAKALQHARHAYRVNFYFSLSSIVLYLFAVTAVLIMATGFQLDFISDWFVATLTMMIELGVMALILWALEYGTDLQEESELTI